MTRDGEGERRRDAGRGGASPRRPAARRGWWIGRAVAVAAMTLGAAGCASLVRQTVRPYLVGPDGQEMPERTLRARLVLSGWDAALAQARSEKLGGPSDALLRALYEGTVAYYAGRWDESAVALDRAAAMSDDRYTKSASRGALAIATSDRVLPYVPGHTERLFVHYYAMLGFLQRHDPEGAAVEARRLSFLLQQYDEDRDALDASTRAVLRYVAGAAFEAAGERNDADVAYRNAAALSGSAVPESGALALAPPQPPPPAARPPRGRAAFAPPAEPAPPTGEVLVVVEQGFVAHRVGESMYLTFGDSTTRRRFASSSRALDDDPTLGRALSRLAADAGLWAGKTPATLMLDDRAGTDSAARAAALRGDEVATPGDRALKLAWPAYRRSAPALLGGVVFLSDHAPPSADSAATTRAVAATTVAGARAAPGVVTLSLRADVSDAVAADLKRDRPKLLARLVARAAARSAMLAAASKKSRDLAELVAGAARTMEQADTRSWHLLPASIGVARVRVPVGRHSLTARVDGRDVALGEVEVTAGGLAFATVRAWAPAAPPPAPPRASAGI